MIETASVRRPPMSNVRAISPVAVETEDTMRAVVPVGGEPAVQVILMGDVTDPGTHQPAQEPSAIRTWLRPLMNARLPARNVVALLTTRRLAAVIAPVVSNW